MERVTQQEIEDTLASFEKLTEPEIRKLMRRFEKKQTPLLLYTAAVAEREQFNDEEYDLLVTTTLLVWQTMERKCPKMKRVKIELIEQLDDELYKVLERNPAGVITDPSKYGQPVLLASVLEIIEEAKAPVSEQAKGMIFFTVKTVLDALIQTCEGS